MQKLMTAGLILIAVATTTLANTNGMSFTVQVDISAETAIPIAECLKSHKYDVIDDDGVVLVESDSDRMARVTEQQITEFWRGEITKDQTRKARQMISTQARPFTVEITNNSE